MISHVKDVLPGWKSSRLIPRTNCSKVLTAPFACSTLPEFWPAEYLPANRQHLPWQEFYIQGILTPFSSLRFLLNTFYRTYVGKATLCSFDQAALGTHYTLKVHLTVLRPWRNLLNDVKNLFSQLWIPHRQCIFHFPDNFFAAGLLWDMKHL